MDKRFLTEVIFKFQQDCNTNGSTEITEVPEYILYEVVNRAAAIALENIESQRASTKIQLNNIQE